MYCDTYTTCIRVRTMVHIMAHMYHGIVPWYTCASTRVRTRVVRTYVPQRHNFLIGKGHTCALRTTCVLGGYTRSSQLRERANAGQHTPTLSLPPSHHCFNGEVYRGNRHYNVCEHVGLDTNQNLHHPPERDTRAMVPLVPWYRYTCTYL